MKVIHGHTIRIEVLTSELLEYIREYHRGYQIPDTATVFVDGKTDRLVIEWEDITEEVTSL